MRKAAPSIVLFVLASILPGHPASAQDRPETEYDRWYEALRNPAPDPGRGFPVNNLVVVNDAATFHLQSGQISLLSAVNGRTYGAVWVGEGRFTMEAPIPVEREQLKRFFETEAVDERIKRAVFFFTDEVAAVFPGVAWQPFPPHKDSEREVEEAMKFLSDGDGWLSRDIALPLMNNKPGFFYGHVADGRGDPLIFQVTPYQAEEVTLSQKRFRGRSRETVSQFHQQADYETGRSTPQEGLDLIRVTSYDSENTIERNLDYSARATLSVVKLKDDFQWVPFSLYWELEIDSILWGDGSRPVYARPKERSDLWIDFESAPADSPTLSFYYQGELLDRYRDLWVEMKSTLTWLPIYENWRPSTYRLTFHHHERFKVASVGYLVEESEPIDEVVTTVWETPMIRQATFNIGRFDEHLANDPRIPNLKVQVDERAHIELGNMAADANMYIPQQRDMAEQVTADIANSFAFFNEVYGQTTVDEFTATEIPFNHGEAYTGLVLLSWSTFQWTAEKGFDEMFRAHEVAHQWWGIGIHPATYHDRWLSEGFAEFSGLWYMGRVRASHEMFLKRLKETREAITDRRDEAAPIWLGTRAGNSRHTDDYTMTVYRKGAWVLHMLRVLLTDHATGSDARFEAMIKDFYSTYFGQSVTTEQFIAVVEEHAGMEMDWFFQQYVYGTGVPEYRFSYKIEAQPSGEQKVTVRVRQEKVPETFRMIVPIYLDFGDAGSATVNIDVQGPETVMELPLLPMEPLEVVFNPFESVLAEVKTEGWRN